MNRVLPKATIAVIILGTLMSFSLPKDDNAPEFNIKKCKLPGVVEISENFFCDKTETRNLDWCEYTYWTRRVFGPNSDEYRAALPDTNVWVAKYPQSQHLKVLYYYKNDTIVDSWSMPEFYLRHPIYRDYPVVGISQKQARAYAKWRSDRVFEFILIKYKAIKPNFHQKRNCYFSIERYFNGEYCCYEPIAACMFFPDYRLPSPEEWKRVRTYSDSVDSRYYGKHKGRKCNDCSTAWEDAQLGIVPFRHDTLVTKATVSVYAFKKASPIQQLIGNVCEWTSESGICAGGGWADNKTQVAESDVFHLETQNAWTGFRCVCSWRKWGDCE